MKKLVAALTLIAAVSCTGLVVNPPHGAASNPAAPILYPCHSDTHMPQNFTGTAVGSTNVNRNNPNVGLNGSTAKNPAFANGGYYYLDITACSTTVHVQVTSGCWRYMFGTGQSRVVGTVLYQAEIMSTIDLTFTHAIVGQRYFMRVQNADPKVATDVASIDSPATF